MHKNTKQAFEDFLQAYKEYDKLIKEINDLGKDVYLTDDFDKRLSSFTIFMRGLSLEGWVLSVPESENLFKLELGIDSSRIYRRFLADIRYLKSSIKEVTLGTREHK